MAVIRAAILAGGASSRMGSAKAGVSVGGATMLDLVTAALEGFDVAIVGGDGPDRVSDLPGTGPLRGIAAALRADADAVFVTAVDQPWLRPATVARLCDRFAGTPVVPRHDGVPQVTCAVYPTGLAERAAALALEGAPIKALLEVDDHVLVEDWHEWGEDGRSWFSVDTPRDLAIGLERYGTPG
jgi:molybdopterin-guanine dinucleotide biosynthesis protein A